MEDWLRGQIQGLIQDLLEEEVTEFLGRARSVRRSGSDSDAGYRPVHRAYSSGGSTNIATGTNYGAGQRPRASLCILDIINGPD